MPFLLVGKDIPRWWKIDSKEMRQRRLFFQESRGGWGGRLGKPISISRSYSRKSPTLREEYMLRHPKTFSLCG